MGCGAGSENFGQSGFHRIFPVRPPVEETESSPFFSIGVPTYDRAELLKQCISSITGQTFKNFEVIIGNDYTSKALSADLLATDDPRIRIVNHSNNLGEIGNMNSLLQLARGKYFTWQFDDDAFAPDFLEATYSALAAFNRPNCVYTSHGYIWGCSFPNFVKRASWTGGLFSGRQFLRKYLSGKLKVLGCCGVFETEHLKKTGGLTKLCNNPIGAHSEHLILLQAGLLNRIAFINEPLVLYRNHEDSWSYKNKDVNTYKEAGRNFIMESIKMLTAPPLRDDFERNFSDVLGLSLNILLGKLVVRDGYLDRREFEEYLLSIKELLGVIQDSMLYKTAVNKLEDAGKEDRMLSAVKARFKACAPVSFVRLAHKVRAFISQH